MGSCESALGKVTHMFKNKQLNENLKAFVQNTQRHCVCFSSPGAMISEIAGHGMNYVSVCQHFKDNNKRENNSIL